MDEKDTNRLEAFSDGVFAVAITLLVLNIKIPGSDSPPNQLVGDNDLLKTLVSEWPMFAAYVTSFTTIGIMWLNHHRIFVHIKRTNTMLILLNLLLLLIIVFIPVPTALLANYLGYPALHVASIIYSGTFFIMACCFNILWRYASYHNRLLARDANPKFVAAIGQQYLFGPLLYLIALGLSWINFPATIIFSFILALFFAFPGRPLPYHNDPRNLDTARD